MTDLNYFSLAGGFGSVRKCVYLHAGVMIKSRYVVSFSPPLLKGEAGNRKLDALIDVTCFLCHDWRKGVLNLHFSASKHVSFYYLQSILLQRPQINSDGHSSFFNFQKAVCTSLLALLKALSLHKRLSWSLECINLKQVWFKMSFKKLLQTLDEMPTLSITPLFWSGTHPEVISREEYVEEWIPLVPKAMYYIFRCLSLLFFLKF